MNNLQEFFSGTSPSDAHSFLAVHITAIPLSETNALLNWPAATGKTYHVQFRDDLAGADWQDLPVTINIAGNQGSANVWRTNDTRVFRVSCDP
jgi:hypothetical protein